MLVAEKTHHINACIYGQGADYVVQVLQRYIPDLEVLPHEDAATSDDEEYSEVSESDWYKQMASQMTSGDTLRIRRENRGLTQTELSGKTGIAISNISLMEAGKRPIGIHTAKKLASALECDISDFI